MSMDQQDAKLINVIAQAMLTDMHETSALQVRLAEKIGFGKGYEEGFAAGVAAAQRDMRSMEAGRYSAMGMVHPCDAY